MEYPAEAQKILDILNRTDFKNIKKSEVISLVSKLNDLNPDVAREIIAQFPEVAEMLKVAISEYTENIKNILESNEKSSDKYFEISKKGVDSSEDSKASFIEMANKVLEDLSKVSDDSSLSFEQRIEIFDREKEKRSKSINTMRIKHQKRIQKISNSIGKCLELQVLLQLP